MTVRKENDEYSWLFERIKHKRTTVANNNMSMMKKILNAHPEDDVLAKENNSSTISAIVTKLPEDNYPIQFLTKGSKLLPMTDPTSPTKSQ